MSDIIDYELDETIQLDSPERMKAAADPVRSLILDLVLERAMTVTELALRVGKSKGTIAHHVDVLVDCGLVKVVRVRKVRAMEERFYGRVARTIVFPDHQEDLPFLSEVRREFDTSAVGNSLPGGWTFRHARIPVERAAAWNERFDDLVLEFSREPRGGDTEFAVYLGFFPTNRKVAPPSPKARAKGTKRS